MIPIKDENPTRHAPILTVSILCANVGVFLYAASLGHTGFEAFTMQFGLIPFEVTHFSDAISPTPVPLYLTLVTSMFMHGGWMHLGGNMLYLWIFGNNVEDVFGHFWFLAFYLLCGMLATLGHVSASPDSAIPLVGASGAIAGVLGAYLVAFPRARVLVLIPIFLFQLVRIPAAVVLGLWFIIQLFNASTESGGAGGGVAWYAHVVGFVVGYLLMYRRKRQRRNRFV